MTMPHLMNCPHSGDGWCLECVKELHDEAEILGNDLNEAARRMEKAERDYLALLPLAYAAEEWASGRLDLPELAAVVVNGFNDHSRGVELMSRLIFLEGEEKSLLNEIAYLKAALERETKQKKEPE